MGGGSLSSEKIKLTPTVHAGSVESDYECAF